MGGGAGGGDQGWAAVAAGTGAPMGFPAGDSTGEAAMGPIGDDTATDVIPDIMLELFTGAVELLGRLFVPIRPCSFTIG